MAPDERRLESLEQMMEMAERTTSNILGRLESVEVAVSENARMATNPAVMAALGRDVETTKQRLEVMDRSWRGTAQKLEDELRSKNHQSGLMSQQQGLETRKELDELKHHVKEMAHDFRKVDAAVTGESRQNELALQDSKWALDSVKHQFENQRDQLLAHQQKIENVLKLVSVEAQERESMAAGVKQAFEAALSGLSEQNMQRIESEIGNRLQLTQDVVQAFKKLRDEIAAGFTAATGAQDEVGKAVKAVESILRAEIRGRLQSSDSVNKLITTLDKRTTSDTQILVQGLKDLDVTLADTRKTLSTEYRASLEQIASRVHDLQLGLTSTNKYMQSMRHAMEADWKKDKDRATPRDHPPDHASLDALRAELQESVAREITLASKQQQSHQATDYSGLRGENARLKEEVRELRAAVAQAREYSTQATEGLRAELQEALEAAAEERREIVEQMQAGFESERRQWVGVTTRLQEELARKAKADKDSLKKLRTDVAQLKGSRVSHHIPKSDTQDPATAHDEEGIRHEMDEVYEALAAMETKIAGMQQSGAAVRRKASVVDDAQVKDIDARLDDLEKLTEGLLRSDFQLQADELRSTLLNHTDETDQRIKDLRQLFEDQVASSILLHTEHDKSFHKHTSTLADHEARLKLMEAILEDIKS